ncbi:MAG: hypothetical protein CVT77_05915 [Alphaproteobacteria bacterium HGW-Alphaproteobacteria-16]|nr:MAG: hypothetical protein CVT77_05915 [Alphaproteobacteria bacterium HGW-Alphaproteobacteria-16]
MTEGAEARRQKGEGVAVLPLRRLRRHLPLAGEDQSSLNPRTATRASQAVSSPPAHNSPRPSHRRRDGRN